MQLEVTKGLEMGVTANLPICFKAIKDSSIQDELEQTQQKQQDLLG